MVRQDRAAGVSGTSRSANAGVVSLGAHVNAVMRRLENRSLNGGTVYAGGFSSPEGGLTKHIRGPSSPRYRNHGCLNARIPPITPQVFSVRKQIMPAFMSGHDRTEVPGVLMRLASWTCKVIAGMGFASYAIFSAAIGAVYMTPLRSISFTPIWSRERSWTPFDGPDSVVLILGLLLIAASLFVRPAASTAYWDDGRVGRREAWGRILLRAGAGLFLLGIFLSIPLSAWDPAPATVESIRAVIRAERSRDQLFRVVQPLWGVVLVVSLTALLMDMVLRHRSERTGWRPRI